MKELTALIDALKYIGEGAREYTEINREVLQEIKDIRSILSDLRLKFQDQQSKPPEPKERIQIKPAQIERKFVTLRELSVLYNIPLGTLRAWAGERRFPVYKISPTKLHVSLEEFEEWLKQFRIDTDYRPRKKRVRKVLPFTDK
jgi:hypothetical protein